jgi:hypothetical protein
MHLDELIMQRRVGDRGEMENGVERFVSELLLPIHRGQVLRDYITAIAAKIFEISGAKIIDDGQARAGKFSLQGERKIRGNETGPAGD